MYPVDFIPAAAPTNYVGPPAPMSPPNLAIPAPTTTAGLILTPTNSQVLPLMSTNQYPPLPAPATTSTQPMGGSKVSGYSNKVAHLQQQPSQPTASPATAQGNHVYAQNNHINNINNNNNNNNIMNGNANSTNVTSTTTPTQALLTIDTSHTVERINNKCLKVMPPAVTPITSSAANNLVATPIKSVNGQPLIQNKCVELYIS